MGETPMRTFEKQVMLQVIDTRWKEHLATMDLLRQGIHLRGYAQKNPKQEYKREAFELFRQLLDHIKRDVVRIISQVQVRSPQETEALEYKQREQATQRAMEYQHVKTNAMPATEEKQAASAVAAKPYTRIDKKVGRNQPCPCGSGKKFKQCHGKLA
jgi:preprotein translocase subunit SecA